MAIIKFSQVWKTYPKEVGAKASPALTNITFHLEQGETLGLVGANGAGKSTTLRLLMGFLKPDKGSISILDSKPYNHLILNRIGYLPETASFPSNLTIADMIGYAGRCCMMSKEKISEASASWLKTLGLWEAREKPLRQYSKGMQQRANFVIALLHDPDILILDEPMSGLDPFGRVDVISLIQKLKQSGKTILFCSHILEDVDRLVDNVLILHKGKNLFHGNVNDLCQQQGTNGLVDAFLKIVKKEK